ncbi:30S ribosomal protein S6 [Candidatus Saganbacteria bacterium CG08_land_8_20_14_0_20_45_16]|uniref:Small ribosomal subunit protein bS6 n=1 Tax=Candidatus Saganbacteria bacterium CG08_land_8_20_14_0_20_45_16 TaxID=2014293 RepID=A0A2H0Y1S4_UNCSA|nr:MAG: 30S ribosomal protein S6 [Candidatus Saganbacteria bacterium CG08_land_8_20_14_0_20_45_16]
MNSYELTLILDPVLGEERINAVLTKVEDKIKEIGGEVKKTDKWGLRKLASIFRKTKKLSQAYYVLIFFEAASSLPAALLSYLKVNENILRYSVFRVVESATAGLENKSTKEEPLAEAVSVGEIKGVAIAPEQGEGLGQS